MCFQIYSNETEHLAFYFQAELMWTYGLGKTFEQLCRELRFNMACYTTGASVVHGVCVQVRKTGGDVFHAPHIKVQIFDLEYRRLRQGCWKRHSPIYKQGLSDRDVLQEEWSGARECVWVDGWGWGVGHQPAESRAESGGSHFTQVTAVVLRDISTQGERVFFFLKNLFLLPSPLLTSTGSYRGRSALRMPMSHSLFKKPGSVLVWMEPWRCDGASFVSMELNGSHVEMTRRGAKRNSGPPFVPAVKQWSLFRPQACWDSCEPSQNRQMVDMKF